MKKHKFNIKTAKLGWGLVEPNSWVRVNPSRLGSTRPSRIWLGLPEPSKARFVAAMETQGREKRKRKKEGEEEGLGGWG
ncbi:hypothetical protein SLEP1_g47616 [Rubroshorea leprosula]|uniref:Uncharacterized protein n=1 Tax=Rubroshorea leprosula TaxID=152421 RepID=A0AAV5LTT7_9ROSI|nr:hypothetical protein SLEP1_g47616 [Rubroshorea leprosula]